MRNVVTSALELAGLIALTVGAWIEFGAGIGLIVLGVCLVVLGVVSA